MGKEQFCCNQHRYQWHKAQRIWSGQLEESIRESLREELERRLQRRGVRELTESSGNVGIMEICGGMGTAGPHECLGRPGDCGPGSSFNLDRLGDLRLVGCPKPAQIGRASCRARV